MIDQYGNTPDGEFVEDETPQQIEARRLMRAIEDAEKSAAVAASLKQNGVSAKALIRHLGMTVGRAKHVLGASLWAEMGFNAYNTMEKHFVSLDRANFACRIAGVKQL